MRLLQNSDIYKEYIDKGDNISAKIFRIIGGQSGSVILNDKLKKEFETLQRVYKEQVVLSFIKAIKDGNIILIKSNSDNNLPTCLPFVKFKKGGETKLVINLTNYLSEKKDSDTGDITYSIDIKQLYVLCLSGYIYYKLLDENVSLSPLIIQISSTIWSRMFNKVLIKTIGLNTNKERYEAFMYFGMRFFMKYYLDCPDVIVNNISETYLKNGKTYLINYMESKIKDLNLNLYESFESFCHILFNNEVSNIKGIKVNNVEDVMNRHFYMKRFIDMYGFASLLSLSSFPYFLFTIISSFNWSKICNDRSMEDVVFYDNKEIPKLLTAVYKELY